MNLRKKNQITQQLPPKTNPLSISSFYDVVSDTSPKKQGRERDPIARSNP